MNAEKRNSKPTRLVHGAAMRGGSVKPHPARLWCRSHGTAPPTNPLLLNGNTHKTLECQGANVHTSTMNQVGILNRP